MILTRIDIPPRAGVGLRREHYAVVREERPAAAWLEVHPEGFMHNARKRADLLDIRADYPIALHAVGLSIGAAIGMHAAYLALFKSLIADVQPGLVSGHLAWNMVHDTFVPDLMALPYTNESLDICASNIDAAQDALQCRILIENPSSYYQFTQSHIPEPEFLAALVQRTDCGILLDVNNICVSAHNDLCDPGTVLDGFLTALDPASIGEIHLADHLRTTTQQGEPIRIDTHVGCVSDEVMALYARTIARIGPKPTLLEWDSDLPDFTDLTAEAGRIQAVMEAQGLHV